jgi:hypothetical protein
MQRNNEQVFQRWSEKVWYKFPLLNGPRTPSTTILKIAMVGTELGFVQTSQMGCLRGYVDPVHHHLQKRTVSPND